MKSKDIQEISDLFGVDTEFIEDLVNEEVVHQAQKMNSIWAVAIDYFKTSDGANLWFTTKNRGLGSVTPLSLLNSDKGIARVENSIVKLSHGMTA
ncbi:MAG: antitoxin Xre/MbcA/ParS toxin-binding domain-containing protein [Glaciecola sp.]